MAVEIPVHPGRAGLGVAWALLAAALASLLLVLVALPASVIGVVVDAALLVVAWRSGRQGPS